jgi:hypothetical protein
MLSSTKSHFLLWDIVLPPPETVFLRYSPGLISYFLFPCLDAPSELSDSNYLTLKLQFPVEPT